ncbi:MAG: bifunctional proline dehydrogenase/L-glutamate gamma-semialdehyde dehydrogenase [bacterium]
MPAQSGTEAGRRTSPDGALGGILRSCAVEEDSPAPRAAQKAVHLARHLQARARALQTPLEKRELARLERMMRHPRDKATLTEMTDQAFRASGAARTVSQLAHLLDSRGVPAFFGPADRLLLRLFRLLGPLLPGVCVSLVKEKMCRDASRLILPGEEEDLARRLEARRRAGVRLNINFLGEALLGEEEAEARMASYLSALRRPEIEVISVKISTIYSQISPLGRRHSVEVLCGRMERLFRAAAQEKFIRADGSAGPKFVYLDMEEYPDVLITEEAFVGALEREGLERAEAGIALQSYLPDSHAVQRRINEWARRRTAAGGGPVTVRLVKGANLEAERVSASLSGWPQAPFMTKAESDANFKRMLHEGMRPENIAAVRLGIASHNLFDMAYALVLAEESGVQDRIQFEMLEGMANHQMRALREMTPNILLYAPAVAKEDFLYAVGYLMRRLDESSGRETVLRHNFGLKAKTSGWNRLEAAFLGSFEVIGQLSSAPRRSQNRRREGGEPAAEAEGGAFAGEPDTDFSLPENVRWAEEIIEAWRPLHGERAREIPLVIGGEEILEGREVRACEDPSRPGAVVGRYRLATGGDVRNAAACARRDPDGWRRMTPGERSEILRSVARELRRARGDLLGAALADGGKIFAESDPEVSEAVDFVEYYRRSAEALHAIPGLRAAGKGVVAVLPPWNFPISIPCGGVAAALAAGNTVILKPASDSVLVAHELCRCFWRGGVSPKTLQFAPCPGAAAGADLAAHPEVDAVILTGGTDTALRILANKPDVNLLAETGGKNATVVTALSDREQAIAHVLHSAFSHGGQKCSATSLLILEEEVYEDPKFRRMLCDAVRSLRAGSAWELHTRMGPLIRPPAGDLENALTRLEPGESWAVAPEQAEDNPRLWTPGVKWGVRPGSYTHMTEFFGPVLAVMKAKDLEEAIALVNQTGYGLTSGLESLDEREHARWREGVRAGNLYINRVTTGAVVLRQPFGGMGKSAFGPGIKAGGPHYIAQLMDFEMTAGRRDGGLDEGRDGAPPGAPVGEPDLENMQNRLRAMRGGGSGISDEDISLTLRAIGSYAESFREEFGKSHDHFRLVGEDNLRRYLPARDVRIRLHPADTAFDVLGRVCAAKTVGARITLSLPPGLESNLPGLLERLTGGWTPGVSFVRESDEALAKAVRSGQVERLRYAAPDRAPGTLFEAANETGFFIARAPVLAEGRIELLWHLQEQSISHAYHRHGNLGQRAGEERAAVR